MRLQRLKCLNQDAAIRLAYGGRVNLLQEDVPHDRPGWSRETESRFPAEEDEGLPPQLGHPIKGQAEAVRLGISRALIKANPENKPVLRKEGLVTRDSRMVERKKPGRRKARRKFQFSKR